MRYLGGQMRRREFISLVGTAVAAWPVVTRAQQYGQIRRIGVLMNIAENDPQSALWVSALVRGLEEQGWSLGKNVQIDYRWAGGDSNLYRKYAPELVALAPDVILVVGGTGTSELQRATRTIPIVFVGTTDPVNRGLIASMARPGGNTTGFIEYEFGMSGKWLELLKQIAPGVSRVMVVPSARVCTRWILISAVKESGFGGITKQGAVCWHGAFCAVSGIAMAMMADTAKV